MLRGYIDNEFKRRVLMYISAIAMAPMGSRTLLSDTAETNVAGLLSDGYLGYNEANGGVADLARAAIAATLSCSTINARDVDAVIYVTESFFASGAGISAEKRSNEGLREGLLRAAASQLPNAFVYGIWMSGCANLAAALSLGQALVQSGRHCNIVLVLVDAVMNGRPRGQGMALLSDAGVACLLSSSGEWRVGDVLTHMSGSLTLAKLENKLLQRGRELLSALRHLRAEMIARTGKAPRDFRYVLGDNLPGAVLELVEGALGLAAGGLSTPNKSTLAHSFSADCLTGLHLLGTSSSPPEEVLLVNCGMWSQGLIPVQRTNT